MHLQAVARHADCAAIVPRAQEEQLSVSGRNWGDAVVDKSSLVFRVDKKTAFNIAIPDVSQVRDLRMMFLIFSTEENA